MRVPTFAALLLLAPATSAQDVNATVGPNPAPLGCPISVTVSIDYTGAGSSVLCPYTVFDDQLNPVYDPGASSSCDESPALIGPWGWVTSRWNQVDQSGQPVAPGDYWIRVTYDVGPPTFHLVTIGGVDAGLVLEGTPTIQTTLGGDTRNFFLCSPQDPGGLYGLLASFTATTGFPSCGGQVPLDLDSLFLASLTSGSLFPGGLGTLNGDGISTTPHFAVPDNPALVGITLSTAFLVLDAAAACPVKRVSGTHEMTVLG